MSQPAYVDFVAYLKNATGEMVKERQSLDHDDTSAPSDIWAEVISVFGYLKNLSPEDLANIRFHTGLVNGVAWQYWHPFPEPAPEHEARALGYLNAVKDLPEQYQIGEPPTPGIPRPLGVSYKGKIINSNVVRYQNCIATLYHAGVFDYILGSRERQVILEIGGGYGGLAHAIGEVTGNASTYVLVDLPEMLFMQGAFLAINNPGKRIYVYERGSTTPDFIQHRIFDYDFVLIPNYALSHLQTMTRLAILLNMQSFQEMTEQQVSAYLDFASARLGFCVYSDNLDRHPYNRDLESLGALLEARFDLFPDRAFYEQLFQAQGLQGYERYLKHLGFVKGSGKSPKAVVIRDLPRISPLPIRIARRIVPIRVRRALGRFLNR